MSQNRVQNQTPMRMSVYAASVAIVSLGLGFSFANRVEIITFADQSLSTFKANLVAFSARAPLGKIESGASTIYKKPIANAEFKVTDVRGTLNSMIPLALIAKPAESSQALNLLISGLPPSAYLTAGYPTSNNGWVVKATDIANLNLVIPQSSVPNVALKVAAIESDSGQLAAPAQKLNVALSDVVILPTSATPEP